MTGALMAGGQSRRMGRNKALIGLKAGGGAPGGGGGETIISRAVAVMSIVFDDLFIVANDTHLYDHLGCRIFTDIHKGAGSLAGVHTALVRAADELCFVAACDMPRLDATAVRAVKHAAEARSAEFDAFVPFIGGRLHPMHAVYSRACAAPAEEMILAGEYRVTELFSRVRTLQLTEDYFAPLGVSIADSVENVNTAEELRRLGMDPDAKRNG